jgi:hypothetical protein
VLRFFAGATAHAATRTLEGVSASMSGSCAAVRCSAGPGPADAEEQEEENKEAKEEDEEGEDEEEAVDVASFSVTAAGAAPTKRSRVSVSQSLGHRSAVSTRASGDAASFSFSYSYESLPPPSHGPSPVPVTVPSAAPLPASLPTAADTVVISVSFELKASAEPTNSDKTSLKTKIASALGVDEGNLKGFTVVSSLTGRLSNTLLRQRRDLLAIYTWTASFDLIVSLAATTSSSSSDLVSSVATALTDPSFVSDISDELGAVVDITTVVVVRITRQPTAAPTTPPTAKPVPAGSIGGTSTGDANSTGAKEAASPVIGIVIGLLGACVFAVATSYFIYRRKQNEIKDGDNHDLNTFHGDKSSAAELKPLKKEHAPSVALNLLSVAVPAVSMEVTDFVDGSAKEFLFAQAKITSAKRLEELAERFKEHGFESVEDFRGKGENELTDAFLKGKIDLNASEIRRVKAFVDASKVGAFKAKNVPIPLGTQV